MHDLTCTYTDSSVWVWISNEMYNLYTFQLIPEKLTSLSVTNYSVDIVLYQICKFKDTFLLQRKNFLFNAISKALSFIKNTKLLLLSLKSCYNSLHF